MKKLNKGDLVEVYGSAGPHPTLAGMALYLRGDLGHIENDDQCDLVVKLVGEHKEFLKGHCIDVHSAQVRLYRTANKNKQSDGTSAATYFYGAVDSYDDKLWAVEDKKKAKELLEDAGDELLKLKVVGRIKASSRGKRK